MDSYERIVRKKLVEAKSLMRLLVLDFDGTLYSQEAHADIHSVLALISEVLRSNCNLAIISARSASGYRLIVPPIQKLLGASGSLSKVYFAGGNGTNLYKIAAEYIELIYNFGLTKQIIDGILSVVVSKYCKTNYELNNLGVKVFSELNKFRWKDIISDDILTLRKHQPVYCFIEDAKVSLVLPKKENEQIQIIDDITEGLSSVQKKLAIHLQISRGDKLFAHITRAIDGIDPKQFALSKIMRDLRIGKTKVVVIGDMPDGNDKGMLVDSGLPYTFTNANNFNTQHNKIKSPPYLLLGTENGKQNHPVETVHKTVRFLLSNKN